MKITICELNRENEPFATCSLPLRDALLHTNRRADMSLALLAGPRLMRMHDALDGGDEVGVIDLWCMLRAEGHSLPGINRAIAQQSSSPTLAQPAVPRNSRVMPQIQDDDRYNDFDLALGNAPPVTSTPVSTAPPQYTDKNVASGEPSNYPPMRQRRFSATSTSTNLTNLTNITPTSPSAPNVLRENPEHDSGIIVNDVHAKIKSPDDMRQVLEKNYDFGRLAKVEDPHKRENQRGEMQNTRRSSRATEDKCDISDMEIYRKYENIGKLIGPNRNEASKKCVKILPKYTDSGVEEPQRVLYPQEEEYAMDEEAVSGINRVDITVLWLALNEECEAMVDPHVQRVYVAYTFLGRTGAELETPVSLPKPKHYVDKCYFNFKKTFELEDTDLMKLSHMARCRAASKMSQDERDCIIFSVVSEPAEDPLGLESCEDIGYAYLYLGDLLAYSAGSPGYTEVLPVRAARGPAAVCGVLAVRLDGLHVVRRCLLLPAPHDPHS
ncbi:unnamed protein product [Spodoptera littoralis]|uniref:RPGRIP1 C-terminal domain-containing protein n=1 Tax=Spodoptera littoralis TaxID=7109 RepID=A0A9P0I3M2_SPOLI|nr:unnamed protein product [Spodoptera littoralis]CAH1639405.1 unnamed protein product [Spodoptera littoralis]